MAGSAICFGGRRPTRGKKLRATRISGNSFIQDLLLNLGRLDRVVLPQRMSDAPNSRLEETPQLVVLN